MGSSEETEGLSTIGYPVDKKANKGIKKIAEGLRDSKKRVPLQMQDLNDRLNWSFLHYNIMYVRTSIYIRQSYPLLFIS